MLRAAGRIQALLCPPLTLKPSRLGKTLWILTTSSLEPGSWKHFLAFTSFSVVSGVILYCIP